MQSFIPSLSNKITKKECNRIRKEYGLLQNSKVDVKTALDIFRDLRKDKSIGLEIWCGDTLITTGHL